MLIAGSDDGVYRVAGLREAGETGVRKTLDTERVMRVRTLPGFAGAFAATRSGLYHSPDGEAWTDLNAPREQVYAVAGSPDGDRLYAGTRPVAVYRASVDEPAALADSLEWTELTGFQQLPSREEWRLPRHENLAQVRDIDVPASAPDRVVAGVEVGGVHLSDDRGETWTERTDGVDDDVHELHVVDAEEFVAATGFGLYHTTDAGQSWTRLDEGYEQRYFRTALAVDGTIYAGGALANSSTWDDPDADPALFASRDGETLDRVEQPRPDETVTGMVAVDGSLVAATHRGTLLVEERDGLRVAGSIPVPDELTGRYTPLAWL